MTATSAQIVVQVNDTWIKRYPNATADLGTHLAQGGKVTNLGTLLDLARRNGEDFPFTSGWVEDLDSSGLAYLVEAHWTGSYKILGASPYTDRTVRPVYDARGYGAEEVR